MPTIPDLPIAAMVRAEDEIPISQDGVARSVSVGTLLGSTQPAIMAATGKLLGRVSIGPGGPEDVTIGDGLVLSGTTLNAAGPNYTILNTATLLNPADSALVTSNGSNPRLLPLSHMRELFSAGSNVAISSAGVISAVGTGSALDVGSFPTAAPVSAQDRLAISQNGTNHSIAYSDLIDGETIDAAPAASAPSDGDSFWVAQGSNIMVRQTFSAVWPWIAAKMLTFKTPIIEISTNTTLDGTTHNGRVLVCSQPVTLTPIATNMGSGFVCDVINLSAGAVNLAGTIVSSSGQSALAAGQEATLRCVAYSGGTVIHMAVHGTGSAAAVPGAVTGLTSPSQSTSSIALSWVPPAGTTATAYSVEYRLTGSTVWTLLNQITTATTYTITGLAAGTSYDVSVLAGNAAGTGPAAAVLTVPTTGGTSTPGIVAAFSAGTATSSSVPLTWQAPSSGGAVASYTVQYRISGSTTWTGTLTGISATTQTVTGLTAGTAYDFVVLAVNAAGTGPSSSVVSTTTQAAAGLVSAITWNIGPSGPYVHGSGAIPVNVHVTPATAAVQFGFSSSPSVPPTSWTAGGYVNTDLWGAYVPTPAIAGTWYAWASGTDGSAPTRYTTTFTVT